jgi:hypothetical protein
MDNGRDIEPVPFMQTGFLSNVAAKNSTRSAGEELKTTVRNHAFVVVIRAYGLDFGRACRIPLLPLILLLATNSEPPTAVEVDAQEGAGSNATKTARAMRSRGEATMSFL